MSEGLKVYPFVLFIYKDNQDSCYTNNIPKQIKNVFSILCENANHRARALTIKTRWRGGSTSRISSCSFQKLAHTGKISGSSQI